MSYHFPGRSQERGAGTPALNQELQTVGAFQVETNNQGRGERVAGFLWEMVGDALRGMAMVSYLYDPSKWQSSSASPFVEETEVKDEESSR